MFFDYYDKIKLIQVHFEVNDHLNRKKSDLYEL